MSNLQTFAGISIDILQQLEVSQIDEYYENSDFAEELKLIVDGLKLAQEDVITVIDEDGDESEFKTIASHLNLYDSNDPDADDLTDDENSLVLKGWKKMPTQDVLWGTYSSNPDDVHNYYKDGCVYSFASRIDNWFPAAIILINKLIPQI